MFRVLQLSTSAVRFSGSPKPVVATLCPLYQQTAGFKWVPPRTTGHSANTHRSNRAKEGLFHGKDIRSGHTISFSHKRSKRKFRPNVQNKRLWSDALNDWVRFKITTVAIRSVDHYGGIDNYLLNLDERLVKDSNYVTKMRRLISAALYHQGKLAPKFAQYLGYSKTPPPIGWTRLTKVGDYYYEEGTPVRGEESDTALA
jgi:large subunit ribosomal protein L28